MSSTDWQWLTIIAYYVGVILTLGGYSYATFVIFGHQTYWRTHFCIERKSTETVKIAKDPCVPCSDKSFYHFSSMQHDLMLEIVRFLYPNEILALSRTNKRFREAASCSTIWNRFDHQFFSCYEKFQVAIRKIVSQDIRASPKLLFFLSVQLFPHFLACELHMPGFTHVIVTGKVFSLPPEFLVQHPGGQSILEHYHRRDASAVFFVACHSNTAVMMAKQYLQWSTEACLGQPGNLAVVVQTAHQYLDALRMQAN